MINFAFYVFLILAIITLAVTFFVFCKMLIDYASYSDSISLGILFVISLISFIMSFFAMVHFYSLML